MSIFKRLVAESLMSIPETTYEKFMMDTLQKSTSWEELRGDLNDLKDLIVDNNLYTDTYASRWLWRPVARLFRMHYWKLPFFTGSLSDKMELMDVLDNYCSPFINYWESLSPLRSYFGFGSNQSSVVLRRISAGVVGASTQRERQFKDNSLQATNNTTVGREVNFSYQVERVRLGLTPLCIGVTTKISPLEIAASLEDDFILDLELVWKTFKALKSTSSELIMSVSSNIHQSCCNVEFLKKFDMAYLIFDLFLKTEINKYGICIPLGNLVLNPPMQTFPRSAVFSLETLAGYLTLNKYANAKYNKQSDTGRLKLIINSIKENSLLYGNKKLPKCYRVALNDLLLDVIHALSSSERTAAGFLREYIQIQKKEKICIKF